MINEKKEKRNPLTPFEKWGMGRCHSERSEESIFVSYKL